MALEGNALFGQIVVGATTGMVPRRRPTGVSHSVARFDCIRESVRAYISNLNSHRAYAKFRGLRARQRETGGRLDSWLLAHGLLHYSESRAAYVDTVRELLKSDTLALLPDRIEVTRPGRDSRYPGSDDASSLLLGVARRSPSGGEDV